MTLRSESDEKEVQEFPPAADDPKARPASVRRLIAILLIALLWVVVGGILVLVAMGVISVQEIKEFNFIFSPIAVLVSAATGFYYGARRD